MKLLLDTHIWIWSQVANERLSPQVQAMLLDPGNERWVSPVSVWELTLLVQKRRFHIAGDVKNWVKRARAALPVREAHLTIDVVLAASDLNLHPDPANRWLAATAQVYGLTLITSDRRLLALSGLDVVEN